MEEKDQLTLFEQLTFKTCQLQNERIFLAYE